MCRAARRPGSAPRHGAAATRGMRGRTRGGGSHRARPSSMRSSAAASTDARWRPPPLAHSAARGLPRTRRVRRAGPSPRRARARGRTRANPGHRKSRLPTAPTRGAEGAAGRATSCATSGRSAATASNGCAGASAASARTASAASSTRRRGGSSRRSRLRCACLDGEIRWACSMIRTRKRSPRTLPLPQEDCRTVLRVTALGYPRGAGGRHSALAEDGAARV